MSATALIAETEILRLRQAHYNAEVLELVSVHEDLRILRVRPDGQPPSFDAGQYTTLGLGGWEPRVPEVEPEAMDEARLRKLLKRAYSFSCPMLDERGKLLPPQECDYLEFYVVLVRFGEEKPPGLTPRLFHLAAGDRLFVGPKVTGHYTLAGVRPQDTVVLVATGTGEAPHNAMVAELLARRHEGPIVSVICSRYEQDLGYLETHRDLAYRFPNYRYLTLTTREPENLDPSLPNFVGRRHLQEYFESGDFARDSGARLDPRHTHVFLCGNPAMIGPPVRGARGADRYPRPKGMVEVLERLGFAADEPGRPGSIHFEKYW